MSLNKIDKVVKIKISSYLIAIFRHKKQLDTLLKQILKIYIINL